MVCLALTPIQPMLKVLYKAEAFSPVGCGRVDMGGRRGPGGWQFWRLLLCLAIAQAFLPGCNGDADPGGVPVADAGPDCTVEIGSRVTLDGTGSFNPDGTPLAFSWEFLERPAGSTAVLDDPTVERPTFTADQPGAFRARLVVGNGLGESGPALVTVTAAPGGLNAAPVARAGRDVQTHAGTMVVLDGRDSFDPDNDPLSFEWAIISQPSGIFGSIFLSAATTRQPSFVPPVPGDYEIRLIVRDGRGGVASDFAVVRAFPFGVNINPVAIAGDDRFVPVFSPVALDGSASFDPDGTLLNFEWRFFIRPPNSFAILAGDRSPQPFFIPDVAGTYTVQLTVRDPFRAADVDTVIVIALDPGENAAPVAVAGDDRVVPVNTRVVLDGTRSFDPEGGPLQFEWALVPPVLSRAELVGAQTATPFFAADLPGTYRLVLTVRDLVGDIGHDTVLITAQ